MFITISVKTMEVFSEFLNFSCLLYDSCDYEWAKVFVELPRILVTARTFFVRGVQCRNLKIGLGQSVVYLWQLPSRSSQTSAVMSTEIRKPNTSI